MPVSAPHRIALLTVSVMGAAFAGLSAADSQPGVSVRVQGLYGEADQNRRADLQGYEAVLKGASVGVEGRLAEHWRLGLDYRGLDAELRQDDRKLLNMDGEVVTATVGFASDRYLFDLGLSHGRVKHDFTTADDHNGTVLGAEALLGYRYPLQGTVVVEPLLQLRYAHSKANDAAPLQEVGQVGVGLRWTGHFQAGPGRLEQRIRLMALRDYIADDDGTHTLVMLGDQPMLTHPTRPDRHSYLAGLGIDYHLGDLTLAASYDYLERSSYYADHLSVEVRYGF